MTDFFEGLEDLFESDIKIDPEFESLIPPLIEEDKTQLEESLIKDGCRDALVVWNGILVDGHNRYRICQEHNIPFKTTEMTFQDRNECMLWMIKNQFGRRNLTKADRILLAQKQKPILEEMAKANQSSAGGDKRSKTAVVKSDKSDTSDAVQKVSTQKLGPQTTEEFEELIDIEDEPEIKQEKKPVHVRDEIAKLAGVSSGTVAKFEQIQQKKPELIEDIRSRKTSIDNAYKTIKTEEKKQKQEEKEARKTFELDQEIPDGYCTLYCADICDGLSDVEDESIDFIITDPPYPKEYLSLYSNLSEVASRVLKPNGSLIVMTGQSYLPEVINRLSENMTYHWCLAYETPGGQSPQLFQKKVNSFWKPVLWFTKERYEGDWIGDVLKSPVNDNDKRYHEWGQSLGGIKDIVKRFTNPGDTILDPFLGGGTTGVAAVTMKRKFVGTDIDQKNINVSNERIKKVYAECLN